MLVVGDVSGQDWWSGWPLCSVHLPAFWRSFLLTAFCTCCFFSVPSSSIARHACIPLHGFAIQWCDIDRVDVFDAMQLEQLVQFCNSSYSPSHCRDHNMHACLAG